MKPEALKKLHQERVTAAEKRNQENAQMFRQKMMEIFWKEVMTLGFKNRMKLIWTILWFPKAKKVSP